MRIVIFSFLILGILNARENPFVPANSINESSIKATNVVRQYEDFDKKIVKLPSSARVLKYIKIGYQAFDGSIKEQKMPVNGKIDWHEPLVLTTQNALTPPMPMVALENTLKQSDNISVANSNIKKENPIQTESKIQPKKVAPTKVAKIEKVATPSKESKKSFKLNKFLSFDIDNNVLILHTKDTLIRDFTTLKPRKLVFDFKRDNSFYTKTLAINLPPFTSVTVGSHKDFYRASFLLDGPYLYSKTKIDGDILIKLK